jgi:radical SAM/Cys-rich protein
MHATSPLMRQRRIRVEHTGLAGAQQARLRPAGIQALAQSRLQPTTPVLPPPQPAIEQDYREHLRRHCDIECNHLYVLTNMPIQRFGSMLISKGEFERCLALLKCAYQPQNLEQVMCRTLLSVDWQGYTYDAINQMLGLPLPRTPGKRTHLRELMGVNLRGNPIAVRDHCYGCTAGQGSSCAGALV